MIDHRDGTTKSASRIPPYFLCNIYGYGGAGIAVSDMTRRLKSSYSSPVRIAMAANE